MKVFTALLILAISFEAQAGTGNLPKLPSRDCTLEKAKFTTEKYDVYEITCEYGALKYRTFVPKKSVTKSK